MQCMGKCDAREAAGRGCRVWNGGSEVHRARGGITLLIDEDTPGVGASAQRQARARQGSPARARARSQAQDQVEEAQACPSEQARMAERSEQGDRYMGRLRGDTVLDRRALCRTTNESRRPADSGRGWDGEGRTTERATREPENQRKMTYPWQLCSTEENFLGGGRVSLSRGERRAAGLDRRKAACPVSTSQRTAG